MTDREQLEVHILEYAFGDEAGDHAPLVHRVAASSDALGYVMELAETLTILSPVAEPSCLQRLHVLLDDVMIAMGQSVKVPTGAGR